MFRKAQQNKNGIALLTTVILISIIVVAALSLSNIAFKQIRISSDIKESATAIVAADAGGEYALYQFWHDASAPQTCTNCTSVALNNTASYSVNYNFTSLPRTVTSIGSIGSVRRIFRLTF